MVFNILVASNEGTSESRGLPRGLSRNGSINGARLAVLFFLCLTMENVGFACFASCVHFFAVLTVTGFSWLFFRRLFFWLEARGAFENTFSQLFPRPFLQIITSFFGEHPRSLARRLNWFETLNSNDQCSSFLLGSENLVGFFW